MNRAAIRRVGKIYRTEDGGTVIDGWHIDYSTTSETPRIFATPEQGFTEEGLKWVAEVVGAMPSGPPLQTELDPNAPVFGGWSVRELAEISLAVGEGTEIPS